MRKTAKSLGEKVVKDIKRATRKHYSSEGKIRIVLDGLRGECQPLSAVRRPSAYRGTHQSVQCIETGSHGMPAEKFFDRMAEFLETNFGRPTGESAFRLVSGLCCGHLRAA